MGYTHITVNHSKEFMNAESAVCTNCIESEWHHAKFQYHDMVYTKVYMQAT